MNKEEIQKIVKESFESKLSIYENEVDLMVGGAKLAGAVVAANVAGKVVGHVIKKRREAKKKDYKQTGKLNGEKITESEYDALDMLEVTTIDNISPEEYVALVNELNESDFQDILVILESEIEEMSEDELDGFIEEMAEIVAEGDIDYLEELIGDIEGDALEEDVSSVVHKTVDGVKKVLNAAKSNRRHAQAASRAAKMSKASNQKTGEAVSRWKEPIKSVAKDVAKKAGDAIKSGASKALDYAKKNKGKTALALGAAAVVGAGAAALIARRRKQKAEEAAKKK